MGTGPSSGPILLLLLFCGNFFVLICIRCVRSSRRWSVSGRFYDGINFYFFGGVNDKCGVTWWAVQKSGMLPLLPCDSGMTAWLKQVQLCPGKKRKAWWCQSYRWFKRSVRDHTHVQMALNYCGLRDSFTWRETMIYELRYCCLKLFVYGWLIPLLISWVLTKSTKHSTNSSQQYLYQKKQQQ